MVVIDVQLYLNSTILSSKILLSNIISHVMFSSPFGYSLPITFQPSNLNINYNLNFTNPLYYNQSTIQFTSSNIQLSLIPKFGSNVAITLNCDFTNSIPKCLVPLTINSTHTPLNYNLKMDITYSSITFSIIGNTYYYLETQYILNVKSWIINSNITNQNLKILSMGKLNPNFNWYYFESITNSKRIATVDSIDNRILNCPFPSFTDQFFNIYFGLNSAIPGLGIQVSNSTELLQIASIGFEPS